jgi:hypothetical protein
MKGDTDMTITMFFMLCGAATLARGIVRVIDALEA